MRKYFALIMCCIALSSLVGCSAIKDWWCDNKEEIKETVISKISAAVEKAIDDKVNKLLEEGKITETYAAELKAKCKKAINDVLAEIESLKKLESKNK